MYSKDIECSVDRPIKELVGFEKIRLNPNDSKKVDLTIKAKDLAFYDVNVNNWNLEVGKFRLLIGNSSRGKFIETEIDVK